MRKILRLQGGLPQSKITLTRSRCFNFHFIYLLATGKATLNLKKPMKRGKYYRKKKKGGLRMKNINRGIDRCYIIALSFIKIGFVQSEVRLAQSQIKSGHDTQAGGPSGRS